MARIVASLLHRPNVDKSKRAIRIPVGGHTEKTLLRGMTKDHISIDEVAWFPPKDVVQGEYLFTPETEEEAELFRSHPGVFTEVVSTPEETEAVVDVVPEMVVPTIVNPIQYSLEGTQLEDIREQMSQSLQDPEFSIEVSPSEGGVSGTDVSAEEVAQALDTEEELAAAQARVEEHQTKVDDLPSKIDSAAFLSRKAPVIKADLATGLYDTHLDELEAGETASQNRKNVLNYITGRRTT